MVLIVIYVLMLLPGKDPYYAIDTSTAFLDPYTCYAHYNQHEADILNKMLSHSKDTYGDHYTVKEAGCALLSKDVEIMPILKTYQRNQS